ncbi:MAG TPA: carboxypeptidase regulatory-like domain-containing protein [Candidatus Solibacter sp.]|nr:carboxypeptidase regulatory-like domain-containing protein [Candidatus Solibacter sp.]
MLGWPISFAKCRYLRTLGFLGRLSVGLLLAAASVLAQTPDAAGIRGQVLDQSRGAVAGVDLTLTSEMTGAEHTAQTEESGVFVFAGVPIGRYMLLAHKQGFADVKREIVLEGGTTANVELRLSVSESNVQVFVTGSAGEIRTDEPQLGDRLGQEQIQEMPLLNQRITYLPLLNAANRPAINMGDVFMNEDLFTTNGSGRRQTAWVVDGSTSNDSWGRQTIFSNVPRDAVQEMTVLENAFSAEFGATTGGVVNMVTKSGGDVYHGDLEGLWRPSNLGAKLAGFTTTNATSGNQIVTDGLGQLDASLSGRIPKLEKTYFFFSGEYSRQNRGSPVTSPLQPEVFVGHYAGWLSLLRIDHQINDANTFFFRANTDSFHDTNPNGAVGGNSLPTVDRIFRRRTYTLDAGETAVISPSLVNSARATFQLASPITEFDPVIFGTQFVVPISTGGTFTSGTSQSALLLNRQYGVNDTVAWNRGAHQIKFGADLLHAHNGGDSKEFGGPIFLGQLTYNTCTQALTVCESSTYLDNIANVRQYTQSYGNGSYTVDDTLWALYAQDDWRIRRDLTLNLGLRYERQTFTDGEKNFAPRVGFAYNWRGEGKTVIRGGFGIYYSQVVDNSEANYALSGPTGVFNFTATPGQIGFPASVADVPLPAFPAGAVAPVRTIYIRPGRAAFYNQFFPVADLIGYPDALLNPYSEQWTLGVERRIAKGWVLGVDYVGSHTVHVVRPLDVDPPTPFVRTMPGQTRTAQQANCTRPLWVQFYADAGRTCNPSAANPPQPAYAVITSDVNNGYVYYEALNVNLSHQFSDHFAMLASYVYSHTIDNVDPDATGQNPNDPNFTGSIENGNALFDQRHRFVVSGMYSAPWGFHVGGIATLASGLPFNYVTGTTNSGDSGATTDRPVINGVVVGRNTGRGRSIYDFAPFLEKEFPIKDRLHLRARAEAFNIFNHANFVGYSGTFGNGATAGTGFGQPLTGITNELPTRSFQFSARLQF